MLTRLDKIDAICEHTLHCDATFVDFDWSQSTAELARLLNEAAAESSEAHGQALAVLLNWDRFDVLGQHAPIRAAVHRVASTDTCTSCGAPMPARIRHHAECDGCFASVF